MHSAEKALRIRPKKRDEFMSWFGSQPEEIRLEIIRNKIQTYHRWVSQKGKELSQEQADYAALLSATMDAWRSVTAGKRPKDFDLRVQIAKKKKKDRLAPVATTIEDQFLPLIEKLRHEGLSWREISKYIRNHHHRKFAHAYLCKIYTQWHPEKD